MEKCFAESSFGCRIFEVKRCQGCDFYKTQQQHKDDEVKTLNKLKSLNTENRSYISNKYNIKELD